VLFFRWDVKHVSLLSVVPKDPIALIVRVGVLTLVSALIPSWPPKHLQLTIGSFVPLFSPVTIPQVGAVNDHVFLVNLPNKNKMLIYQPECVIIALTLKSHYSMDHQRYRSSPKSNPNSDPDSDPDELKSVLYLLA
jgi:hypothetical protein